MTEVTRQERALRLLKEWWRLHCLANASASAHADYLAYVEMLTQVRELMAEDEKANREAR